MEVTESWTSPFYRQIAVMNIDRAIMNCSLAPTETASEMEVQLFSTAKSKEEYIELVARQINFIERNFPQKLKDNSPDMTRQNNDYAGQVTSVHQIPEYPSLVQDWNPYLSLTHNAQNGQMNLTPPYECVRTNSTVDVVGTSNFVSDQPSTFPMDMWEVDDLTEIDQMLQDAQGAPVEDHGNFYNTMGALSHQVQQPIQSGIQYQPETQNPSQVQISPEQPMTNMNQQIFGSTTHLQYSNVPVEPNLATTPDQSSSSAVESTPGNIPIHPDISFSPSLEPSAQTISNFAGQRRGRLWSHKFFAFGNPTVCSPTLSQRRNLQYDGLGGPKLLSITRNGFPADVKTKIYEGFPPLQGKELKLCRAVRAGSQRPLTPIVPGIPIPSVAELRSIRVGVIYVVPIDNQPNLPRPPSPAASSSGWSHSHTSEQFTSDDFDSDYNDLNDDDLIDAVTMKEFRVHMQRHQYTEQNIILQREDFCLQVLAVYKKPKFNLFKQPNVIFVNEPGSDAGALKREFFYLGMTSILAGVYDGLPLFEGQDNHKLPTNDISLLQADVFKYIGLFLAHSAIHTSVACIGFSPVIYTVLCSESDDLPMDLAIEVDDIPDLDIREVVLLMRDTPFNSLQVEQLERIRQACQNAGFFKIINQGTIHLAMEQMILYHVYFKRKEQIMAIKKAFRESKLLDFISKRPYLWESLFPRTESLKVSCSLLKKKINFYGKPSEFYILDLVHDFIDANEGRLEKLLRAWTGWPFLPDKCLELKPVKGDVFMVHSCFQSMEVPIGWGIDKIYKYLNMLIDHGHTGFGSI